MDEDQVMFERLLSEFVGAAPHGVNVERALAVQMCLRLNVDGATTREAALRVIRTVLISVAPAEGEVDSILTKIDGLIWPASNGQAAEDVGEQLARAGRA